MAPTSYEQELSRLQMKHDYHARMTTQAQQEMQELRQRVHAQSSRKRATSDIDRLLNPEQEEEEEARLRRAMDIGSFLNPRDANNNNETTTTTSDESSSGVEEEEEAAQAAQFVPLQPRFVSSRSLVAELTAQLNNVRARADRRNAFLDRVIELA